MDNLAFEMHEDAKRKVVSEGKMNTFSRMERTRQWSLMSIFLVCLLACTITTVIGVLILSLVYVNNPQPRSEPGAQPLQTAIPVVPKAVDPKVQFLNHLSKSKVFEFPGGAIQWARYRNNAKDYLSMEEEAFGSSLNSQRSQMSLGTLRIKSSGLRAPHWHFNANEHGYLVQTLDVDDVFFSTPEDIASRSLKPEGGISFIRTFHKQKEDQGVNLPPNLAELVVNANYSQSPDSFVWRYFYDLKGSKEYKFPGGIIQLAQYWKNRNELSHNENIFSEFLNQHRKALTLSTLRIYNNGLRQPHFHFNANEMGYVISGCAKVGIINAQSSTKFNIHIGDVIFFPTGTQHYIKSTCDEDLLLILAFSTGDQLQTLDMDDYLQATADHILAQLFFKKQSEFKKIPQFKEDQAVNMP
ncbi:legumin J-like isoform X2 [Cervus elaphus]|uniref:legumin J-like isoform X2 n=1 Tax=Cervus elaphus TaxID=9860 RepID=UPI001CC2C713|nr:legumin J-like isoform X2 [Cervus elaphus]